MNNLVVTGMNIAAVVAAVVAAVDQLRRSANRVLLTCLCLFLVVLVELPCAAGSGDPYLGREFDWSMFVELQDAPNYLDYRGSLLHPLSKVRVHLHTYPSMNGTTSTTNSVYEEFWYHNGKPLGSRRVSELSITTNRLGAIVIGPLDARPEQTTAAVNATVRLIMDLQLKQIGTHVVFVPYERYDAVAGAFEHYRFLRGNPASEGVQMSINLRSYPAGIDERLFLR